MVQCVMIAVSSYFGANLRGNGHSQPFRALPWNCLTSPATQLYSLQHSGVHLIDQSLHLKECLEPKMACMKQRHVLFPKQSKIL